MKHLLTILWCCICGALWAQPTPAEVMTKLLTVSAAPPEHLASLQHSSHYTSPHTGLTHYYWTQHWHGLEVLGGMAQAHTNARGQLVSQRLQLWPPPALPHPQIDAQTAVAQAATWVLAAADSTATRLVWRPLDPHTLQLAWEVTWYAAPHQTHVWRVLVDAQSGAWLAGSDWVQHCFPVQAMPLHHHPPCTPAPAPSPAPATAPLTFAGQYRHLAWPAESPSVGTFTTWSEASLVAPLASPLGWRQVGNQTFGITRGNNVYAYYFGTGMSNPSAVPIQRDPLTGQYLSGNVPAGGPAASFVFNQSLASADGLQFLESSVVQAFVTANRMHDLLFQYGFDEASGNFQASNLGNQGLADDEVLAEVQRGPGLNQASFLCFRDGLRPRLRLHLWDYALPDSLLDAAFDNLVVAHEYAHGLLFRLVGGPANVNCLNGHEQGSEGYCDFVGLLVTLADKNGNGLLEADTPGEGIRTVGTYLKNEPPAGPGLRAYPYSPNLALNPVTYDSVPGFTAPHAVGMVWGSILWDILWELIDTHGFEPDLYQADSPAGNVRALRLVVESLRYLACDPTFIDMRDALLVADTVLYQGAHSWLLWNCFARRGLGVSAAPGGLAAYDLPAALPVQWLYFTARPAHPHIALHWATAAETDNAGFAVERHHDANPQPRTLGWVAAAHNPTGSTYQFFDKNVTPGVTYYYRLRQKDITGQESLSPWRTAALPAQQPKSRLYFWPNPASTTLHIAWQQPADAAQTGQLRVVDMWGKTVAHYPMKAPEGISADLSQLPPGMYTLWWHSEQQLYYEGRFIRQH